MWKRSEDIKVANVVNCYMPSSTSPLLNIHYLESALSWTQRVWNFKWVSHWYSLYVKNYSRRVARQLVRTFEKRRVYLGKGTSIPPCGGVSIELILLVGHGFIVCVIYDPFSMSNKEIGKSRMYVNTFMRAGRNLTSVLMQFRSYLFQTSLSSWKDVV